MCKRKMWRHFLKEQGMCSSDDTATGCEETCKQKHQRREKRRQLWTEFMQSQTAADSETHTETDTEKSCEEEKKDDKHVRFETSDDEMKMTQPIRDFPQPCAPRMKSSDEPELTSEARATTEEESDGDDCPSAESHITPTDQFAAAHPKAFWHFKMMRRHRQALQGCAMAKSNNKDCRRRGPCRQSAKTGLNPQTMKAWRQFKRQQMGQTEHTED